ncbi:hypothetical protein EV361DRAFT_414637 [Lentinula raphanica]|nr:hypothetical protein F5880DRAFT_1511083 [Lentinula raphanica]KAJ3968492.1 hypothetical protein EV361DRAFT_414637 [Lentinula raphanica]
MTRRSTSSRTRAILVLAAAISSSVLAAPVSIPPPLPFPCLSPNPFSSKAHPPQSRSVDQTSEVAMLQRRGGDHANFGLRRDGGDLTIDDSGYSIDGKDANMKDMNPLKASVSLERRTKPNSQPSGSSGSTDTGGIPPDNLQQSGKTVTIDDVITDLIKEGTGLRRGWRTKSGKDILEILKKDKEAIDAFLPVLGELLKHLKTSSWYARPNQQLLQEYQTKLQEVYNNAVDAYRRAWMFWSKLPDEKVEILERARENHDMSAAALAKLEGKGYKA